MENAENREMEALQAARDEFISQWGAMGGAWGINRTMAQIHALLLTSTTPLTTDMIMDDLKISRGNANTNLRDLVGWGLVKSVYFKGDRKEHFEAESDIWTMFCTIARERKRREIEPAVQTLRRCKDQTKGLESEAAQHFHEVTSGLEEFVTRAEVLLEKVAGSPQGSVIPKILKLVS